MRASLLMAAISVCAGCSDGAAARQVCVPGKSSVDAAVYAALTATSWFDSGACGPGGDPLPPTCNRLRLGGDGSYTWTAFSDYPERMQAGSWNFRARDATTGVVCLDDGSVVDFALTSGGLSWGPLGQLSAETPSSPARSGTGRAGLPEITVDPLFVELTAHGWAKTNEMDLYREPTSFALYNDGTFEASFRDGECTTSGTFSLIREQISTGTRLMLWSRPRSNVCDTRDGGRQAFVLGDVPRLENGVLVVTGASYRDATIVTGERYLTFSSYSGEAGLTISARWDGALRGNAQTSWSFSLRNDGKEPQVLASLRIDATPAAMINNELMTTGPAVTVVNRPLDSTIAPGDSLPLQEDVAFTPGPTGWALLHVELDSSDSRQKYVNQDYLIVELP